MEDETKKLGLYFLGPLLVLNIAAIIGYQQVKPDWLLHVDFLDVGQGDAIFVESYLGNQMIIDGGRTDQVLNELGKSLPFWDRKIDLMILTHPDADHVGGLIDVLNRYRVGKVLVTGMENDTGVYKEFEQALAHEQAEVIYGQTGQRVWLDDATVFDIYHPPPGVAEQNLESNDTSIIGKLGFGSISIFLGGDATSKVEDSLISQFDLESDILKVGHHGSRYSTSSKFLEVVAPGNSVISVGENNYGHPTGEVLDRLRAVDAEILRTDEQGTIRFVSDGQNLEKR